MSPLKDAEKIIEKSDHFIVDTYHIVSDDSYKASALLFKGKRQVGPLAWKEMSFSSEQKADQFVRMQCTALGLHEADHVDDLTSTFAH